MELNRRKIIWAGRNIITFSEREVIGAVWGDVEILSDPDFQPTDDVHSLAEYLSGHRNFVYTDASKIQVVAAALEGCCFGFFERGYRSGEYPVVGVYHVEARQVKCVWSK